MEVKGMIHTFSHCNTCLMRPLHILHLWSWTGGCLIQWIGEVEIFCVSFLHHLLTALTCHVFFNGRITVVLLYLQKEICKQWLFFTENEVCSCWNFLTYEIWFRPFELWNIVRYLLATTSICRPENICC